MLAGVNLVEKLCADSSLSAVSQVAVYLRRKKI